MLAPEDIPRMYGLAKGFFVRACIRIPTKDKDAPARIAVTILGARNVQTIISELSSQVIVKIL
ncbi:unknown [Fusobacterium nucleatum subsp. nucleatum ATCC 25586]|uniref:Uncharacterized protein n=1 Tax=Fusobacterium nucleatum subsp. nucleatum (strain ATCC 25586 / DSM 15643 / BCRC 10681 / CIP 101130 / JCM 8532 / KCTC 2640 / LMG 13131 / VPI 4355) TaxID=190304 RepID=Q8RF36_FUSNN|nr:unknown [Fusobacterium nucleatum subsp. nucleatum ATCC 25586]